MGSCPTIYQNWRQTLNLFGNSIWLRETEKEREREREKEGERGEKERKRRKIEKKR